MKFKNILLLYKRSAYKIYFMDSKNFAMKAHPTLLRKELERFKKSHDQHYSTLRAISKILFSNGIRFTENYRGRNVDYSKYDLIVTVGGDGTFLEAARQSRHQVVLGVNSAPDHSVGRFCIAKLSNFEKILRSIIEDRYRISHFHRLSLRIQGSPHRYEALNDVLICHRNPAMLCRYILKIGKIQEEQRSSGIWIATSVGSSGAIHSAGGKILPEYGKQIQYLPRELYAAKNKRYRLRGGILPPGKPLVLTSLMRQGMMFIDGAHVSVHLPYGTTVWVTRSAHPVKTIAKFS